MTKAGNQDEHDEQAHDEHGEHCDHRHHDPEHEEEIEKFSLRSAFGKVVSYMAKNKGETAAIAASSAILFSSTALTVPLLPAALSALALGCASLYMMQKTGDSALNNALAFGEKMKISPMKLGLAVGALTTIPELMVSLSALKRGAHEIAIGNVLGGNIAHTLLILGATAAIAGISASSKKGLSWAFNTKVMTGATALFAGEMALGNFLPKAVDHFMYPAVGIGMLAMAGYYLKQRLFAREQDNAEKAAAGEKCSTGACPFHENGHGDEQDGGHDHEGKGSPAAKSMPSWFNAAWTAAGMVGLVGASKLLVDSASGFGIDMGLSKDFVGAVTVGLGISIPELVINVKAALQKKGEFALGNIMGCNIFTTLLVGGAVSVAGAVAPEAMKIATPEAVLNTAMFAGSAGLAAATLMANKGGIKKWQGYTAMALYLPYAAGAWALGHNAPTVTPPQTTPAPIIQKAPAPAVMMPKISYAGSASLLKIDGNPPVRTYAPQPPS